MGLNQSINQTLPTLNGMMMTTMMNFISQKNFSSKQTPIGMILRTRNTLIDIQVPSPQIFHTTSTLLHLMLRELEVLFQFLSVRTLPLKSLITEKTALPINQRLKIRSKPLSTILQISNSSSIDNHLSPSLSQRVDLPLEEQ